jgi:alkylation response protein AidB-like acyl-CoA dehydrogenase
MNTVGVRDPSRPSTTELLARLQEIRPILERNGPLGDELRRVPDESMDALTGAGLFRALLPQRYGGYELPVESYVELGAAVARIDGATGWLYTLGAANQWLLGLMSAELQDEILKDTPDTRLTGVLTPSTPGTRVDGGWRISGRWAFASGCLYSDWAMLGFPALDRDGSADGEYLALLPAEQWTVEDTWHVSGMRGTGSNTVVVDDAFVPDRRTFSLTNAVAGNYETPYRDEALYRAAFMPFLSIVLAAPLVGLAEAALEFVIQKSSTRGITYTIFNRQMDSAAFQIAVSKAAMLCDTARLHMLRAAREIDRAAGAGGEYPGLAERARARADAGYSTSCARQAIDLLLSAHGAGSFSESSPLQRIWRDANTAGRHAVVNPVYNEEIYGKALLGLPIEDNITAMI